MLKWGSLCERLERNVVAYLMAGKMSRSTEIKFEVAESKLSLLLKNNIMHVEKHSCEYLLCTYNHSAIKVIKVLQ